MRRGLKWWSSFTRPTRAMPSHRRFPDEEGTEITDRRRCYNVQVQRHRRFPDEEGTEIDSQPVQLAAGQVRHRRFPDEEGTEILVTCQIAPGSLRASQKIPR